MAFRILDERDIPKLNKSFSNALTGDLRGAIVAADNVSPCEHEMAVKVRPKNLFDISKIKNTASATNNGDGTITIAANTYYCRLNQKLSEVCPHLKSGDVAILTFDSDSVNTKYMYFHGLQGTWNAGKSITVTDEILDSYVTIYGYADNDASYGQICVVSNIQIELGDTATEYTPYVDPSTVKVTRCGKNLIKYPYADRDVTRSGVTYTVKEDGEIVANGTSGGSYFNVVTTASKQLYFKAGVTYHLSGVSKKTGLYYAYAKDAAGTNFFDYGEGASFIPTVSGYGAVTIVITDGSEVSDIAFKPQIEVGNTTTDYEAYKGAEYTPSADGTVEGVTSISPVVTIFAEAEGTVVECEYAKDVAAVIEKLTNAVIALGGSV